MSANTPSHVIVWLSFGKSSDFVEFCANFLFSVENRLVSQREYTTNYSTRKSHFKIGQAEASTHIAKQLVK